MSQAACAESQLHRATCGWSSHLSLLLCEGAVGTTCPHGRPADRVCVLTLVARGNTPWPVESPRGHLGSLSHVADAPGPSVHPPPSQPNQPVLIFHVWHIHLRMSDPASEVESSFPGRKIEELMKLTPQKNKYKYAWPLQAALSRAVIINLPVHQNQHIKKAGSPPPPPHP